MSESIQLPAARQPVIYMDPQTGVPMFSRPWFLFFQRLFERLGGSVSTSVNDLAVGQQNPVGVEEIKATLGTAMQDQGIAHPELGELRELIGEIQKAVLEQQTSRTEVAELRELIAELRKDIQTLSQGTAL